MQRTAPWSGTVFTVVMENHSRGDILGAADAPYINALAAQGAVAAGYHDPYVHPSEPNYLWMAAGENFGVLNDNDPTPASSITAQSHIADQIENAGLSWATYQETMGAPCGLTSHGTYAVKHNPFAFFADINGASDGVFQPSQRCDDHIVDYAQLGADIAAGTVPDYVFITPNLHDDMHDGSVAAGDAWLAAELPAIFGSSAYTDGGVLFLLWDEGSSDSDDPPFIVASPLVASGAVSHVDYDTSAYLKTVEGILGVEALPCSADPTSVPLMSDLFSTEVPAPAVN